jgi:hypothetical protein
MTFTELVSSSEIAQLIALSCHIANADGDGLIWDKSVEAVFKAVANHPDLAPNIKADSDAKLIEKWLDKYAKGYNSRISQRVSKLPSTVADPIVSTIISCRLKHLDQSDLGKISSGHRLSMSAENILGLLLEEHLSVKLAAFGWHYCWGETVRSVDFVNDDGRLLQVKNRSNSENSSSSRVRLGTVIEKWFRVDAVSGDYRWDELNKMNKTRLFSENRFGAFVIATLKKNPEAMPVEPSNSWSGGK